MNHVHLEHVRDVLKSYLERDVLKSYILLVERPARNEKRSAAAGCNDSFRPLQWTETVVEASRTSTDANLLEFQFVKYAREVLSLAYHLVTVGWSFWGI